MVKAAEIGHFRWKLPRSPLKTIELIELLRPDEAIEWVIEIAFLVFSGIVI
ncbi:hypothetical protein QUB07_13505 [Microcoleus sp. F8-C5]